MKNKTKILVITGIFIIGLVSAGIYISNQFDQILYQAGISFLNQDKEASARSENESLEALEDESSLQEKENPRAKGGSYEIAQNNSQANSSQAGNENIVTNVQKKIGQPIEKKDVLIAGLILMRKLSAEDIRYLSKVAMKDSYSQEDYRKSQEILLQKLSADDIAALKKLGSKYGSEVKILNQNAK